MTVATSANMIKPMTINLTLILRFNFIPSQIQTVPLKNLLQHEQLTLKPI